MATSATPQVDAASSSPSSTEPRRRAPARPPSGQKSLTIGAVCKALAQEFPDISISKIRYLEDQKLLTPRRTPGGYRLYTQGDVARLRTILRMQRDEFLPLRVIRQELAAGRAEERRRRSRRAARGRAHLAAEHERARGAPARCTRSKTCSRRPRPTPSSSASSKSTGSSKARCAAACATSTRPSGRSSRAVAELARYGVGGRNLRVFRSSADREANLLQQILAPALRSRNPRAAQGGGRGAREPRGGRDPPQAPAADPRSAQDRPLMAARTRAPVELRSS